MVENINTLRLKIKSRTPTACRQDGKSEGKGTCNNKRQSSITKVPMSSLKYSWEIHQTPLAKRNVESFGCKVAVGKFNKRQLFVPGVCSRG